MLGYPKADRGSVRRAYSLLGEFGRLVTGKDWFCYADFWPLGAVVVSSPEAQVGDALGSFLLEGGFPFKLSHWGVWKVELWSL